MPGRGDGGSIGAVTVTDGFIQDDLRDNFCFGCGADNPDGLQLKSDCHGVGTAISDAFRREDRPMSSDPEIWYATASMAVEYLRPAPIAGPVRLTATVVATEDRRTTVECELAAGGKPRARATVQAVRVPDSWRHGAQP